MPHRLLEHSDILKDQGRDEPHLLITDWNTLHNRVNMEFNLQGAFFIKVGWTPDNCSTGEIFQDSPYRTPRTPTPPPAANNESRNGKDYSRPYVTRTGRVVKPRKIMDI
ncbi:hypothetical protein QYM36_007893 [Artemia franciscana]|uniref:Uncharacterized protein n=1 Tax=Artemia franciscana TaxID=6661 RepID=A0AA88LKK1_ARTSF|nr:hypothetical protein QYM36_007893 [Artemia franciscana]